MKPTPVLFLDLDGTVRDNKKFVNGPGDVEIYEGVVDIIRSYKEGGWKVVAISNQGGIAMGHTTESEANRALMETNRQCANLFDGMLYCPHHPDNPDPENKCICRKPKIGNIVRAFSQLANAGIYTYPLACLFVGDQESDKKCAEDAHIPFMWAKEWRAKGPLKDA